MTRPSHKAHLMSLTFHDLAEMPDKARLHVQAAIHDLHGNQWSALRCRQEARDLNETRVKAQLGARAI